MPKKPDFFDFFSWLMILSPKKENKMYLKLCYLDKKSFHMTHHPAAMHTSTRRTETTRVTRARTKSSSTSFEAPITTADVASTLYVFYTNSSQQSSCCWGAEMVAWPDDQLGQAANHIQQSPRSPSQKVSFHVISFCRFCRDQNDQNVCEMSDQIDEFIRSRVALAWRGFFSLIIFMLVKSYPKKQWIIKEVLQ